MTAYTKATNFLAKDTLPDSDADKIIKGSEFDVEFNALQTAVNSKANTISPALSGTPTAPTAGAGTSTTQIATTSFVAVAVAASFPSGGIIIWSGSEASIPTGWSLCDGTSSTPDLRNRFIVGAGSTYNVNDTGGSADATLPSHTHTATSVVTDPSHSHREGASVEFGTTSSVAGTTRNSGSDAGGRNFQTFTATTGITVATTNSTAGTSATNANLPPYYALCYIMKD